MDNIIFITGALGIGYLIYKNTDNAAEKKNIEESKVLEAVPETKQQEKKIEVTKIGLLPAEDKKALLMNLKNAKPYSSTFAIVTAVVGGVFTSFYISKKMFIVIYGYFNKGSFLPIDIAIEIFPFGTAEFFRKNDIKERFKSDQLYGNQQNNQDPNWEKIEYNPTKQEKLDEIEKKNEDEIFEEDPMLSQGNIPLTDFTGKTGTNFIPFTSDEIKIEENVKIEENIQNANINQIDNISIGVEKEEPKVELTEEEKRINILNEIDNMITIINNIPNSENKLLNNIEEYRTYVKSHIYARIDLIKILNTMREQLKNKGNFPMSNIEDFLIKRMDWHYRPMWFYLSNDNYMLYRQDKEPEVEDYDNIAIEIGYYKSDFYINMEKLIKNLQYFTTD